jgi:hypothetical protein
VETTIREAADNHGFCVVGYYPRVGFCLHRCSFEDDTLEDAMDALRHWHPFKPNAFVLLVSFVAQARPFVIQMYVRFLAHFPLCSQRVASHSSSGPKPVLDWHLIAPIVALPEAPAYDNGFGSSSKSAALDSSRPAACSAFESKAATQTL